MHFSSGGRTHTAPFLLGYMPSNRKMKAFLQIIGITGLACILPQSLAAPCIAPPASHRAAIQALQRWIQEEARRKNLPALSIAVVEGQKTIWAQGFGYADRDRKVEAAADTVYRVGSVSKLFTDIAIMQLVEKGRLDLDAPITTYLPEFHPKSPFDKKITLRQLMAHRSGLVREPPVGNYFDAGGAALKQTVASLNQTSLVYEPETKTKYSNAALAVVGYVLEKTQKEPFAEYLHRRVLKPLAMADSAFGPRPELTKRLAKAVMWSYERPDFPAPTFELGMAPAGSMYSTVVDLAAFIRCLLRDGRPILKPETLKQMLQLQFADDNAKSGFGLGFYIEERNGKRCVGHSGAIYGFATELAILQDEQLGVVVTTSRDGANGIIRRIADETLRTMLAVRDKKPLPPLIHTSEIVPEQREKLTGYYRAGDKHFEIQHHNGKLWLWYRGLRLELRSLDGKIVADDVLHFGLELVPAGNNLKLSDTLFERTAKKNPRPPDHWRGLIGEYGPDHNVLFIFEKDGTLYALIEWFFLYPLEEIDNNTYRFPDYGLYHGERMIFKRDAQEKATEVIAASVRMSRRQKE
ncbi:MAG: hypothetical protein KatS3mg105_1436 [Gemmatales bacterium]|nr:MAG: hypothetical protein KatS3mg105_1436 [Gemmatales bacterium]